MPHRIHFAGQRRNRWCVLVALIAVCSLTISVATRYSYFGSIPPHQVKTVRTPAPPDAKRQRLAKNAVWMPPVFSYAVLPVPDFYPQVAPAGPLAPSLIFEESLFTRPPPII